MLVRISIDGDDDASRRFLLPVQFSVAQVAVSNVEEKLGEVVLQPKHLHLCFRITEAAVEFQHARTLGREHESRVEAAGVSAPFFGHSVDRGDDDRLHDFRRGLRFENHRRRMRSHAAGVRSGLAVVRLLVILRRRHRREFLAIGNDHERDFFAGEVLLDEDAIGGVAEFFVLENDVQIIVRLFLRVGDDHALAAGESFDLDDRRIVGLLERCFSLVRRIADRRLSGWDLVLVHEVFGEDLGALQLGGQPAGTEDRQAALLELVDDSERERKLGSHDGEIHLQLFGEIGDLDDVRGTDIDAVRHLGDARISRRCIDFLYEGGLPKLPRDRVLPRPLPNDQNAHSRERVDRF